MILIYVLSILAIVITIITTYLNIESLNQNLGNKFYIFEKSTHLFFSAIKIFKYFVNNNKNFVETPDFTNFTLYKNIDELNLHIKVNAEDGKIPLKKISFYLNALKRLLDILEVEDRKGFIDDIKENKINLEDIKNIFEFEKLLKAYFPDDYKKLEKYISIYNQKININSAPYQVLLSLDPQITMEDAISILKARPIKNILDLQRFLPTDVFWKIYPYIKNKPSYFLLSVNIISNDVSYNLTGKIYFKDSIPLFYYYKDNWDRKWLLNYLQENLSI